MGFMFFIIGLFTLGFFGILWWNYRVRKAAALVHSGIMESLEATIALNRWQIIFRKRKLNCYDFLKYDLDVALVAQKEIIL
jgi:hypothetical protein